MDSIPLVHSLAEIYTAKAIPQQEKRFQKLIAAFESIYSATDGAESSVAAIKIARAPGRVNVIGEHVDYCGYSVLPAAIERDVLIAFSSSGTTSKKTRISLANMDDKYTSIEFDCELSSSGMELLMKDHHWSNYFKAGLKGMLEHVFIHCSISSDPLPSQINILVTGSVPAGSGLSSSAAMTTASALCILSILGRSSEIDRRAITEIAIESERLVGVNSGGMDQSASVFSLPNHLLHISFVPVLSATPIKIPSAESFSFVIANTLITANKVETSKTNYNLRVVETRLGALLLSKHLHLPLSFSTTEPQTFKSVQEAYFASLATATAHPDASAINPASSPLAGSGSASEIYRLKIMFSLACNALGGPGAEEGRTFKEIAEVLEVSEEEIQKNVVGDFEVEPKEGKLKIWIRARHVLSEALRVYQMIALLKSNRENLLINDMGQLMNDSQSSCRDDFECSCEEIDEMVGIARTNGAIGSRVTGAGWGGATISLVPIDLVPSFIEAIRTEYYSKRFPNLTAEELQDACFATKPEMGALLFEGTI